VNKVDPNREGVGELQCIACGSDDHFNLGRPVLQRGAQNSALVVQCRNCDLQRVLDLPTEEDLRVYYTNTHDYAKRTTYAGLLGAVRRHLWHPWRSGRIAAMVRRYAARGPVLDYGCGEGRILRALSKVGRPAIGLDWSPGLVQALVAEGFDARTSHALAEAQIPSHSLAAVIASHILEHVIDPQGFLAEIRSLLAPRGVLICAVPCRNSLRARLRTSTWHYVDPPNHLWSFTARSLRLLIEKSGFVREFNRMDLLVDELVGVFRVAE
jgi:SAM-dependent methyltransferase